jgi:hypothetical protein
MRHSQEGGLFGALAHSAARIHDHVDLIAQIGCSKGWKLYGQLRGNPGDEQRSSARRLDRGTNIAVEE